MKFELVDIIESLTQDRIVGIKNVSLAEEYLADHFPTFPVLPGVMMLELATQSATWLLHHRRNFACSMAVLSEARNVKYGHFVAPGHALRMEVDFAKETETGASFKASGMVDRQSAFSARLDLAYFNLSDKNASLADTDARLKERTRQRWDLLSLGRVSI